MANDSRPFRFLFNSNSEVSVKPEGAAHMEKIENLVAKLETKSAGRLKNRFIRGSSMQII
jgi:hypothetical protein